MLSPVCSICKRKTDKLFKHHVVPKVKGGAKGEIVTCCRTCSRQVHMLFSENELSKMTFDGLLGKEEMKKYVRWVQNRKGEYRTRKTRRLRRR